MCRSFYENFRLQMQYTVKKKKNMRSFSKEDSKINVWEPQEILTRVAYAKGLRGNNLTRKLPHIKCDGTRISGHEKKIDLPKNLSIFLCSSKQGMTKE